MNFSELSDFEINKAVARCQSLIVNDAQDAALKSKSSSVLVNCITAGWEFNPCNKPSDAWPIIVENGIIVDPSGHAWSSEFSICSDKNPLRAAMIVYLMMQGESA